MKCKYSVTINQLYDCTRTMLKFHLLLLIYLKSKPGVDNLDLRYLYIRYTHRYHKSFYLNFNRSSFLVRSLICKEKIVWGGIRLTRC